MIYLKRNKIHNLGLDILRMILCFWIILLHCSNVKKEHIYFLYGRPIHVPTFVFISFYFFYKNLSSRDISKIILRFQRLLIPYIIWPLIILIINNFFMMIFHFGQFERKMTLKDFYIQILTGDHYHAIFWYHFNLIFLTLLFTIISLIFKHNFIMALYVLEMISFKLHYSQINYNFFIKYNDFIYYSLGPIIEILPIAVIGLTFGKINLINKLNQFRKKVIFFNIIIFYFFFKYDIFTIQIGFRYPCIMINIVKIFLRLDSDSY